MSTIALNHKSTTIPARAKVAAGLCLPLGVMNCVGAVVFWEWSAWTWVGVWAIAMGLATVTGAARTLASRADGLPLLTSALYSQLAFTLLKIVGWQEVEAIPFGVLALIVTAIVRSADGRAR